MKLSLTFSLVACICLHSLSTASHVIKILPDFQDRDQAISFSHSYNACDFLAQNVSECCLSLEFGDTNEGNLTADGDNATSLLACQDDLWREHNERIKSLTFVGTTMEDDTLSSLSKLQHVEYFKADDVQNFSLDSLSKAAFLGSIKHLQVIGIPIDFLNESEKVFEKMPLLASLKISKANVMQIDFGIFSNNKVLTNLDFSENDLRSISFSTDFLSQLSYLNLSGCHLNSIEVHWDGMQRKGNLQVADFFNNRLKYLPEALCNAFSPNAQINLTVNPWQKESCNFYPLWKVLFMNNKAHIGFEEKKPDLHFCGWDSCPSPCKCSAESKLVDCSNKGLTSIPDFGPSQAENLILSGNTVGGDLSRWLQKLVSWCNLKTIYLDYNNITNIFDDEMELYGACQCPGESARNCILPSLKEISLSANEISGFTENDWRFIRRAEVVNLSRNSIQKVSVNGQLVLRDFSSIRTLDLSYNQQESFDIKDAILFPYVLNLNLSHNRLKTFEFGIASLMPELTNLDLSSNKMRDILIPPDKIEDPYSFFVPHLETLFLHKNEFKQMISPVWNSLRRLTLHGNRWNCSSQNVKIMKEILWKNLRSDVAHTVRDWDCYGKETEGQESFPIFIHSIALESSLFIVITCTVLFFVILILFAVKIKKRLTYILRTRKRLCTLAQREYDVCIIYASDANDFVHTKLIPPLESAAYKVAYDHLCYEAGLSTIDNFYDMLNKSRRMIAVISKEFVSSETQNWELKQGIQEEKTYPEFKLCAIRLEPLNVAERDCKRSVFQITFKRTALRNTDMKLFDKIKRFLKQPMQLEERQPIKESRSNRESIETPDL